MARGAWVKDPEPTASRNLKAQEPERRSRRQARADQRRWRLARAFFLPQAALTLTFCVKALSFWPV